MDELELIGLHDDGEHLVLAGADGSRLRLRIDETLRAAVRRDRPQLEQLRAQSTGMLPPREIQAQIRAGMSAEELVETAGLSLDQVRRFEGPVLAERAFVADQARATRVGRDSGAPELGELVTDRLAARGVDQGSVEWDARREGSGPWTVLVRFVVGDREREAQWSFDAQARSLRALEDEARWLSETELHDEPIPRRHLAAVRDVVYDVEADGGVRTSDLPEDLGGIADRPQDSLQEPEPDPTAALLEDLLEQRGVRQQVEELDDDDEEFEGFGPAQAFGPTSGSHRGYETPALPGLEDLGGSQRTGDRPGSADPWAQTDPDAIPPAHPADSHPGDHADPTVLAMPAVDRTGQQGRSGDAAGAPTGDDASGEEPAPKRSRSRSRKGRASVPSWDEIVFGARPE